MQLLLIARLLLAGVFAVAGAAKLADPAGSRKTLVDFGVPELLARPIAWLLPLAELASAIALIPARSAWLAAWAVLALLVVFIIGIASNLASGRRPDCHCFGQIHNEPIGWSTLVRNVVLAALAVLLVSRGPDNVGGSVLARLNSFDRGDSALAVAVAVAGVGLWLALLLLRQNGRLLMRIEALEAKVGMANPAPAPAPVRGLAVNTAAPPFTALTVAGGIATLDTVGVPGKWLLMVFLEPGCNPCTLLAPTVAGWQKERAAHMAVVVISRGSAEDNRSKMGQLAPQSVVLQNDREIAKAYQMSGTPGAVLLTRGTIASRLAEGADAIHALVDSITAPPPLRRGDPVPSLELQDIDGKAVDIAGVPNRTMVLFWNPSCGFCQRMLGDMKAWERNRPEEAPELLVVSSGSIESVRAEGFRARVLLDKNFILGTLFGAEGTPSAALIKYGRLASDVVVGAPDVLELAGVVPQTPCEADLV